jgi:hypothetical protein
MTIQWQKQGEPKCWRSAGGPAPTVIVQTTVNKLRSLAAYDKAKRGVGRQRLELSKSCSKPKEMEVKRLVATAHEMNLAVSEQILWSAGNLDSS